MSTFPSPTCPYLAIASEAMSTVLNRQPRTYQAYVIAHIIRMMSFAAVPEPILMVQPTGSGKSTIPLTCAVINGGVTIVIENTLSLGCDQSSKVNNIVNTTTKHIKSFQLDTFKSANDLQWLYDVLISHCSDNHNSSFMLFSSPETLIKPISVSFVAKLVRNKFLNLFCINEIHLFLEFGAP